MTETEVSGTVDVIWQGEDVAVLSQWFFDDGDMVAQGDVICELMQEKTVLEVDAPVTGKLSILTPTPDTEIHPQTILARLSTDE